VSKALKQQDLLTAYQDVFDGRLGCLEGQLHLDVDESVQPVKLPVRKVPIAFKQDLETELQRLSTLGVIEPVTGPTDWVSSLVIFRKPNGKIRICLDPRPLNRALKRTYYPMPTIEDILPQLSQAKVFTVCDLQNGFWHMS
jgi:hypothetical protein